VAMSEPHTSYGPQSRGSARSHWLFWALGLGILGVVFLYTSRPMPSAVAWTHDLQAGLDRAASDNQFVLIDFYTTWCPQCQVMDRNVFSRQDVARALANWVTVKIDADKQPALAARYDVHGFPTFVAVSPAGEVVRVLPGGVPPEMFIAWIESVEKSRAG